MTRKISWLFLLFSVVFATACRKTGARPESFNDIATATINHYYETEPSCLWFEPVALSATGTVDRTLLPGLEALVVQGVLIRTQNKSGPHFELTETGRRSFRPDKGRPGFGNLCYGNPHVQHIDSTSQRRDETFGDVIDVEYDSAIANAPAWATAPDVQKAFPKMAFELSRLLPHSATLKNTPDGWGVAIGPASAIPEGPAPK